MQDTPRFITQSALRFFSGTLLSRVTGLLRDVAMASVFGTDPAIAVFLVAFRFSHLFRRLLGEGALQSAFIPQFEKLRAANSSQALTFFNKLHLFLILLLISLVICGAAGLKSTLLFTHLNPGTEELLNLTLLMLPSLFFICLFGLNASLLQCEKSYFIPGMAPCAFNLIWIIGTLSLRHTSPAEAMPWLAGWVTLACLGQWLLTVPYMRAILKTQKSRFFEGPFFSEEIRQFLRLLFFGILGVSATQINSALDGIFAWYASGEGPAYLWYAIRLQQLPIGLFGVALSSALLPPLARALSKNDLSSYKHFLGFSLLRCWELMFPITIAIYLLGEVSIDLIYSRGDFSQASIQGTNQCLWGYGFGLIPTCLVLILSPAFYAKQNFRLPTLLSSMAVLLNIGLNSCFIFGFGFGPESVAWSTSLASWFNALLLGLLLYKKIGPYLSSDLLRRPLIDNIAATGLGVVMVLFAKQLWTLSANPLLIEKLSYLIYLCSVFSLSFIAIYWKKIKQFKRVNG